MKYNYRYGGFFQRAAAMLVDTTILMIFYLLLMIIGMALGEINATSYHGHGWGTFLQPHFIAAALIGNMLYFTYFHSVTGQTIGKRLMGLKVVTAAGEPLSWGTSFLRWCGYFISKWCLFLGFFWIMFSHNKRGWHDYLAGTVVVRLGVEATE